MKLTIESGKFYNYLSDLFLAKQVITFQDAAFMTEGLLLPSFATEFYSFFFGSLPEFLMNQKPLYTCLKAVQDLTDSE